MYKKMLIACILFFSNMVFAKQIIVPSNQLSLALLGTGYHKEQEQFLGECIAGKVRYEGIPESNLDFTTSISQNELSKELGLAVGGKYRASVMSLSASAKFLKKSKTHAYSVNATYMGTYSFKNRILTHGELTPIAKRVFEHPERFSKTCGTHYASQQVLGAKIFFSIRLDFSSVESKSEFEANFNLKGSVFSVSADLKKLKNNFSKNTKVTISALQLGGDVGKISQIFHDQTESSNGPYEFVQCSLGQFDKCDNVLSRMIDYATDTVNGFPSQINPNAKVGSSTGPAVLKTIVRPYSDLAYYVDFSPELNKHLLLARKNISNLFEDHFASYISVQNLQQNGIVRVSPSQRSVLEQDEEMLWKNLQSIAKSSEECFNVPKKCGDLYENLKLYEFNKDNLNVRPEIFSQYCDMVYGGKASQSLVNQVNGLLDYAKEIVPHEFSENFPGEEIDTCMVAQKILNNTNRIDLKNKNITDLSIINLFSHLEYLILSNNDINDISMLGEFHYLKELDLSSTKVTNQSLEKLLTLKNLQTLDIRNTHPDIKCPYEDKSICIILDLRYNISINPVSKKTAIARWGHSSVMLKNGNILYSGGFHTKDDYYNTKESKNFEIYHQSLLLNNGNVLLVNGFKSKKSIVEFNLETQSKISWENDQLTRGHHRALVFNNSFVLVTGGFSNALDLDVPGIPIQDSVIYDISLKKIISRTSLDIPRGGHTMTLLDDGRIFIAGGYNTKEPVNNCEIFDPKNYSFTKVRSRLREGRGFHEAIKLMDGRVALIGGIGRSNNGLRSIEIFDPKDNTISFYENILQEPRGQLQVGLLNDYSLVVAGGSHTFVNLLQDRYFDDHCHDSMEVINLKRNSSFFVDQHIPINLCDFSMNKIGNKRFLMVGGRGNLAAYSSFLFEHEI